MTHRSLLTLAALAAVVLLGALAPALGQNDKTAATKWTPPRLSDGQPDIQGAWDNTHAALIPVEQLDAKARAAKQSDEARKVGAYGGEYNDTYGRQRAPGQAASLVVDPPNGRFPEMTPVAKETVAFHTAHLRDSYEYMEMGERCITRGLLSTMMPTTHDNGKSIVQTPGYVILLSEMLHTVRVIPVDGRPRLSDKVRQWEGDPRGHWEGNTLVVESTNFRAIKNIRGAPAGIEVSTQSDKQHAIERFTIVDPNTLKYSITVEDPDTFTAPFTVAFDFTRDDTYRQFEFACHEGNYGMRNMLSGARAQERLKRSER